MYKKLLLLLPLVTVSVMIFGAASQAPLHAASLDCHSIGLINGTYSVANYTAGWVGTFAPGDVITVSVELGTATSGSFRIVGNSEGTVTLEGPSSIPGTLSHIVTSVLPADSIGVGFFIDSSDGTVEVTASCSTDERLNRGRGDHYAVLSRHVDGDGHPAIHLYCVDAESSRGTLGISVTQADLADYPATPETNTLVKTNPLCNARFYILSSGAYQFNVGPDSEGKELVFIMSDLSGTGFRWHELLHLP
jgi:hypothetical protein